MSYLPLCFAGIQILDVWVAISVAGTVYFPSLESGKWSGLPRVSGTVSAGSKRDSGPMWTAEPGLGVGDKVGMITLFPAVGREVQGPIEKGKSRVLHLPPPAGLCLAFLVSPPLGGRYLAGMYSACHLNCSRFWAEASHLVSLVCMGVPQRPIPSHSGLPDGVAPRGPAHHVLRHPVGVGPYAGQSEDQTPGLHRLPQED